MTPKISQVIIRLAGTTCCGQATPVRKNRRLPGTVSGKPGVRHFAGTVFVDTFSTAKI
jgi:hypothetical protein